MLVVQDLFPYRVHRVVAILVIVLESMTGAGVLAAITVFRAWSVPMFTAEAAVYAAYLTYAGALRKLRPFVPCGCFAGEDRVTPAVLTRSCLLMVSAAGAVLLVGSNPAPAPLAVAGGVIVALLARITPAAFVKST